MIRAEPKANVFKPIYPFKSSRPKDDVTISLSYDELEALRLVNYEGLTQEEAAKRMGISRGTVWRCLDAARRKVAAMLVEGKELRLIGEEAFE